MATIPPTVHSWINGEEPDFRQMNEYVRDVLNFIMNPPMLRLKKTNTQNFTSGTSTAIQWNFVELENYNFWDASNPTRITPSVPGWYVGSVGYGFNQNSSGVREMNVIKNGSTTERILRVNGDAYTDPLLTICQRGQVFQEFFNGTTDYMTVEVQQNSGSTLTNLAGSNEYQPDVVLRWIAPL